MLPSQATKCDIVSHFLFVSFMFTIILQFLSFSRWNGAPPFLIYLPPTRCKIRPLSARACLIFLTEVSPSFGIHEAIADWTDRLFVVGGRISKMLSSRHVRLFPPSIVGSDAVLRSRDPPPVLSAFTSFARTSWLRRGRGCFLSEFSSGDGGSIDCRTEKYSSTSAAGGSS